jgi:hypothetical protein
MPPITVRGNIPIAANCPITPMGHAKMETGQEWQFRTGKQMKCHLNNPKLKMAAKANCTLNRILSTSIPWLQISSCHATSPVLSTCPSFYRRVPLKALSRVCAEQAGRLAKRPALKREAIRSGVPCDLLQISGRHRPVVRATLTWGRDADPSAFSGPRNWTSAVHLCICLFPRK